MFDAGPFRVRKYESVVIGLGTTVEVVSGQRKQALCRCTPLLTKNVALVFLIQFKGIPEKFLQLFGVASFPVLASRFFHQRS